MKRQVIEWARSPDGKRVIYIDLINSSDIIGYFEKSVKHRNRIRFIKDIIISGLKNDCYKYEGTATVHAMRFDLHHGNGRVYCQQISRLDRTIVVIASELLLSKKSDKLSHKEKAIINKVASYEYEI